MAKVRDAKTAAPGWTTENQYDALGRLTYRIEAEGNASFVYGVLADNTSTQKYVGRLKSMSGPGYSESYQYDLYGRPAGTTINADTTYQIGYSYNSNGLLDTLTYPTSTSSNPLKLKYNYTHQYLSSIKECSSPACTAFGTTYWAGNSFNARYQLTQETLGNGLVTRRAYDAVTGLMKSIKTGPSAATETIQNLGFEWDLVGNLKKRIDGNQSNLTEEFFYDNLYRMTSSTLNGSANSATYYNEMGNITAKWDSGSSPGGYNYHPTKKHQVISTTTGWSFGYDANGNMTSRGSKTISWTSYNYPYCIYSGSFCGQAGMQYSQFSYTPDRRYWKQAAGFPGAATTIYVGGLLEKVTTSNGTDYRHYIPAGGTTVVVSRQSNGVNGVYYVNTDHLGSSVVFNGTGLPTYTSYEAFGRRRGANWTGGPTTPEMEKIAGITRRGYTGHTMLDNLELIHMNGRVYDPVVGRFLSADPYIPDPMSTQSYNRYSYVQNNPLTMIDPSGFAEAPPPARPPPFTPPIERPRFGSFPAATCNGSTNMSGCQQFMAGPCSSYGCDYSRIFLGEGFTQSGSEAAIHDPQRMFCNGCDRTLLQTVLPFVPGLIRMGLIENGNTAAIFTEDNVNPVTGIRLTPNQVNDARFMAVVNIASAGFASLETTAARGAMRALEAPIGATRAGERFVRVGAGPENLKMSFNGPGGTQAGTHAFPESTFNQIGRDPAALKNFGDLPGAAPQYFRVLEPPAGTAIQRGIVPGGEYGGIGGLPEVYFPYGF